MKKLIKSIDDVFYYVAKECNVSEDLVKNIYTNLFGTLRYYLAHPFEKNAGKGILLNNFLKIKLSEGKLYAYIRDVRSGRRKPNSKEPLEFYEDLYKLLTGETFDERNLKIQKRKEKWQKTNQEKK